LDAESLAKTLDPHDKLNGDALSVATGIVQDKAETIYVCEPLQFAKSVE
jgi:hypothetical protein